MDQRYFTKIVKIFVQKSIENCYQGPFFGVDAPNKIVRYRIFDFYIMREDKIWYNWMILDAVHLLYQAGYDILPNNITPLKQGWSLPPRAMDGLPAPVSRAVNPDDSPVAKVKTC